MTIKDTTYQEKIPLVKPWLEEIIEVVKKDLKNEHLKKDSNFIMRYFLGKPFNQITNSEFAEAYSKDIAEGNIALAEFIATRWLLKNTDVYGFFEEIFKKITPDFEELKTIEDSIAYQLYESSIEKFGAKRIYIFSLFNSVVFPDKIYDLLRERAEKEKGESDGIEKVENFEKLKERYEKKLAAMIDRYEKKLNGFQRKYIQDTELLKKQVSELQKKMAIHE